MKHIAKFVVIFILLLTLKATDSGWDTVPIANAAFDCADPGIECHSGTISSNETWTASQVHFVDDEAAAEALFSQWRTAEKSQE